MLLWKYSANVPLEDSYGEDEKEMEVNVENKRKVKVLNTKFVQNGRP